MDRNAVEAMSQVAQILVTIKGIAAHCDLPLQRMIKEQIGDCQSIMALYCDCSPYRLMGGEIDEIMKNYEYMKGLQETV
jgi:hypothetical protein